MPTIRDLLLQERQVRFHLRLLVIQFLGQVRDPRREELDLLLELLERSSWRDHVLGTVASSGVPWFDALDQEGKVELWLKSEEPELQRTTLWILRRVARRNGDRVARLLQPLVDQDSEWVQRSSFILPFEPGEDSEELFGLRLKMVRRGYTADHVDWRELAAANPGRFILLATSLLTTLALRVARQENTRRPGRRSAIDWRHLDQVDVTVMSQEILLAGWEALARALSLVAQAARRDFDETHTLELFGVDFDTLKPIVTLQRQIGVELVRRNWHEFVELGSRLAEDYPPIELLFLDSLAADFTNSEFADWVLGWLMADRFRVRLRYRIYDNPWRIAGGVLERLSPFCSDQAYQRLEGELLNFREPDLLEHYRFRHKISQEDRGYLDYPSYAGATPHHLLRRLPRNRISEVARVRIEELKRKFEGTDEVFFSGVSIGEGGAVGSPISSHQRRDRLSDQAWLDIISSPKLESRRVRMPWRKGESGVLEESSVEAFSSDLRVATERQPERFARLALRVPTDADLRFLCAILSGLATSSAPKGLSQNEAEYWHPAEHRALEAVLNLPQLREAIYQGDRSAMEFCRIVNQHPDHRWSTKAVEMLVWIIRYHPDPAPDYYPVGVGTEPHDSPRSLESNMLNVTRGSAAFALQRFLFRQPDRLEEVTIALDSLAEDLHPAVRVAAVAACIPVIDINRPRALQWFLRSCDELEALLATRWTRDFLRYTRRSDLDLLRPLISRMTASNRDDVARAGAQQVAAGFLVDDRLVSEFAECLTGRRPHRAGVADVAGALLGEPKYAEKAKEALLQLANDEDGEVVSAVAMAFRHLDVDLVKADPNAWRTFARSRAFQADPSHLLFALEKQSGDLRPFAECLLAVGTTFAEELAEPARDSRTGIAGDVYYLVPLLLRLYGQAEKREKDLHQRCLDLWDRLLERRVGEVLELTQKLDEL